jgi:hypothetical protein
MNSKLCKGLATAIGLSALLALGACGDRSGESAAQRSARNETASDLAQNPSKDAAAARSAQRSGSAELAQGNGS